MSNVAAPLLHRLSRVVDLSTEDLWALKSMLADCISVPAGTALVREGEPSRHTFLLASGWALRERHLRDGSRQVVNFLVPGDLSEPGVLVTEAADHSITTLTEARVCRVGHRAWFDTMTASPALTMALWWLATHEEAVLKEHLVSLGRRSSRQRLLYLLWELWRRLDLAGQLRPDGSFAFPARRDDLADAAGLTPRHLGRVLAELRSDGMLTLTGSHVVITDPARLLKAGDCRDVYLQIEPLAKGFKDYLSQPRQPPLPQVPPPPVAVSSHTGST
ncbi:Crp/Fnr family transcriptional regulator [Caenispirillum bisanense]|uniref:Crp/Fnr family transcriptional regulator n=1 Tax=Caenispirillum bisanense TaxID=414052 RepID=UPI0031D413E0